MNDIRDRAEFGALLNLYQLTGEAVEVGVYRGEFSEMLLRAWRGRCLHLVDPWATLDGYTDPINATDRDADYAATMEQLAPYSGRFQVHVMVSEAAAPRFAAESLDFIYIDADHEEEAVRRDLELWYPKLRIGGIFAGHDYYSTVAWPGVQRAVNQFARLVGVDFSTTWEPGGSWWWRKPA
jgi:hypothetical protein